MDDEITYVGDDADGDPVWLLPSGRWLSSASAEEAGKVLALARADGLSHSRTLGLPPDEYLACFGPVSRVKI